MTARGHVNVRTWHQAMNRARARARVRSSPTSTPGILGRDGPDPRGFLEHAGGGGRASPDRRPGLAAAGDRRIGRPAEQIAVPEPEPAGR